MREQRLAQVTIHQSIHPGVLCHRHHEAELRQSREECWGRQQELAAVKEKLKTTLEDRRKDTVSYKVMPCGSECLPPAPFQSIHLQQISNSVNANCKTMT